MEPHVLLGVERIKQSFPRVPETLPYPFYGRRNIPAFERLSHLTVLHNKAGVRKSHPRPYTQTSQKLITVIGFNT